LFAIIQGLPAGRSIPSRRVDHRSSALIIERFLNSAKRRFVPGGLAGKGASLHTKAGVSEDKLEKLSQDSPPVQVLLRLRNYKSSRYVMKDAIEEAGSAGGTRTGALFDDARTIATISPLMGLFGTVVGMIEIFTTPSRAQDANPPGAGPWAFPWDDL